jgi:hypothetical protein
MYFTLPPGGRCLTASILACLFLPGISFAGDLDIPRGTLTVDRDWIRIGTKSQLSWKIDYPAPIKSVVDVVPPNVIQPKKDLKMKVRLLGASFQQAKSNNGHGNNADGVDSSNPGQGSGGPNGAFDLSLGLDDELKGLKVTYLPVEVLWSKNGGAWSQLYYGTQNSVNPSKVLVDAKVEEGSKINFGARGWRDHEWLPIYHTAINTPNVVVLKNGDKVPSTVPALNGGTIESFLKPYMDTVNKTVKIGDRDLILLFELGQTSTANSGFDLQDLVLLVTFQ